MIRELVEFGCFCGGEFVKVVEGEWRCNKCRFRIVEVGRGKGVSDIGLIKEVDE